ncbi:MAG: hypothetical protein KGJ88_00895 [Verrucomicrobiota bacterium]|nr:hypothetical protein [Verrucomicrobiota bacterium]
MHIESPAWYCARTRAKHEHIAAAGLRKHLGLDVFHPQLRLERATRRGLVRMVEPLFPCYLFVRCVLEEKMSGIQRTGGISGLVRFGQKIPALSDFVVEELKRCFESDDSMLVQDCLGPSDEVLIVQGAFAGVPAFVLRVMPARQRVQVLLDILGRPTPVEVDRTSISLVRNSLADMVPVLAAT